MTEGSGNDTSTEALIGALIGAMGDPALWVTRDRRIVAANAQAHEVLGLGLLGQSARSVIRQPDPVEALERGFEALGAGSGGPFEAALVRTGPVQDVTWTMRVAPVRFGLEGLLITFRDQGQIEAAEQQRRDFVANVSHELRSPLTVLTGFIDTLRGAARGDTDAQGRFLDIMEREAARMNRLVGDLLSLSRVEANQRIRPRDPVDLAEILRATIAALRPQITDADLTVTLTGADAALMMCGDRDQLIQVFRNLIENAIKYAASGKRIDITVQRHEKLAGFAAEVLEVAVRDHGEGIESIHLPRLTERFYRVDSDRSREKGGTGLGLAIVKHIVHRHRGRLSVSSVRGEGSRFAVLLPIS